MKNKNHVLDTMKRMRALERAEHFANGGTLCAWRGGPCPVTVNRKLQSTRNACRRPVNHTDY